MEQSKKELIQELIEFLRFGMQKIQEQLNAPKVRFNGQFLSGMASLITAGTKIIELWESLDEKERDGSLEKNIEEVKQQILMMKELQQKRGFGKPT